MAISTVNQEFVNMDALERFGTLGPFILREFAHFLRIELPCKDERHSAVEGNLGVCAQLLKSFRPYDIRVVVVCILLEQ